MIVKDDEAHVAQVKREEAKDRTVSSKVVLSYSEGHLELTMMIVGNTY